MNKKPKFITFTGADDKTHFGEMISLSNRYPIEWGILFSPSKQGYGRYPSIEFIQKITRGRYFGFNLSAHICGDYSKSVLEKGNFSFPGDQFRFNDLFLDRFTRVQINTVNKNIDLNKIWKFSLNSMAQQAIIQCRDADFPDNVWNEHITYLYDMSGGKGVSPDKWPVHKQPDHFVGYAGGINPNNVEEIVDNLQVQGPYWLDMESGVRDEYDQFSIDKCRQVCEKVYG